MQAFAVGVVGAGRVGLSLAARLGEVGLECRLVRGRRPVAAAVRRRLPHVVCWDTWDCPGGTTLPEVIVVAVPDPRILQAATQLAGSTSTLIGRVVLHTSGLHLASELEPCRAAGAAAASWHPLQSFPSGSAGDHWPGAACAVEGDREAVELGFQLAERLGLTPWRIEPAAKPLYHAAAAVAGNLTFLLVAAARDLLERCGLDRSLRPDPLARLVATATSSALANSLDRGLTGPIARGDREAVRRHLETLPPHLSRVYAILAREVMPDDASDWLD